MQVPGHDDVHGSPERLIHDHRLQSPSGRVTYHGSPESLIHDHRLQSASGRVTHPFSKSLLLTGRLFASMARRIETDHNSPINEPLRREHRSYAIGAIVLSFAGFEASINEFYLETCDKNRATLDGLGGSEIAILAEWWDEVKRRSPLCKYQTALKLTDKPPFERGKAPYQDVDALRKLRNALVHYAPEGETEARVHAHLRDLLESRFEANPLAEGADPWIPDLCLGAECAEWSCQAVKKFLCAFCQMMGIPPRHPEQTRLPG